MKKFNVFLYDNLGREYKRKNLYLQEVAILQDEISKADKGKKEVLKKQLGDIVKNKSSHKYNIKLAEYKKKEKIFKAKLKEMCKKYYKETDKSLPKTVQELQERLFIAKGNESFYEKYASLTYDAELIYEQAKIEIDQIPAIIEFVIEEEKLLNEALKKNGSIDLAKGIKFKEEFEKCKKDQKIDLIDKISKIKDKYKNGTISKKAELNTIKELKRKSKEFIKVKSFEDEKTLNDEIIKSKKYELSKIAKQKINALNINVADKRRVIPVETEKTFPWISYATVLVPGLGQLLNKQYVKSIIMFIGTIYIYLMAIPYALGFGNYKGDGISGLITLAKGESRMDRSVIFMIEGILAIFLISIAVVILILSFRDVYKVEKGVIKGVRENSWCETKQNVLEDGFPYIVSMPALFIIIFIVFIPITTTILLSFTGMDPNHQAKFGWTALENYKMIAFGEGMVGSIFWKILWWTIIWTVGATSLGIGLGFILAIVLNNDRIKGKWLFRSIYLLPWAVPAFITIIFFSIMSSPTGMMTQAVSGLLGETASLKNDPFLARITLICIQAWLGSAYVFLLSTGVLQSISNDLYEAADIDGASKIKKLAKITIPMVLFQTAPLLVSQYAFNFNNFSIIYMFNTGGPFNPEQYGNLAGETDLLISYVFKLTMQNQYQALGAAITMIISVCLMVVAYLGFRRTSAFRKEG